MMKRILELQKLQNEKNEAKAIQKQLKISRKLAIAEELKQKREREVKQKTENSFQRFREQEQIVRQEVEMKVERKKQIWEQADQRRSQHF